MFVLSEHSYICTEASYMIFGFHGGKLFWVVMLSQSRKNLTCIYVQGLVLWPWYMLAVKKKTTLLQLWSFH